MKLIIVILLIFATYTSSQEGVTAVPEAEGGVDDFMEDFPLDETGSGEGNLPDGAEDTTQMDPFMNLNEEDFVSEENKQELLKKVMIAAMARPGARQRLAQVMPILRTMSGPQRLALAGLVTSQLMSPPGVTPPPLNMTKNNLTAELMLPISMDIAAMFRGLGREAASARSSLYRNEVNRLKYPPSYRRRPLLSSNRRTANVALDMLPPPPPKNQRIKPHRPLPRIHAHRFPPTLKRPQDQDVEPGEECEFFSNALCLEDTDYPQEAILKSIQSTPNKNAFEALRVDSKQNVSEIMPADMQMERRQGDLRPEDNGPMCSSKVEIARPKRARATSGQWKYIVNTGDYTQTLRLEMCLKPKQSCSYLADNFKSECTQVYNYHRLLTWDHQAGLTMDIFKVPTCCSCHVQGYSYAFMQGAQGSDPTKRHTAESIQIHPQSVTRPPHPYLESAESNFVADEPPLQRPHPPKLIIGRRPGSLLNIPKRDSLSKRPGLVQHRGPPLPLHDLEQSISRYPPYDNMVRRTLSRPNVSEVNNERPNYNLIRPTPNQRHPQLPADSINESSGFAVVTPLPNTTQNKRNTYTYQTTPQTTPSKRVNYSYHPIIDFFKTSASAGNIEERMDQDEWTPITDGPRLMPK